MKDFLKRKNWGEIVGLIAFFSYYFCFWILQKKYYLNCLDSDWSSELVLSQLLAQQKAILSTRWYYSTELRVLNTQLIYSLLFMFVDNWQLVRIASFAIFPMILTGTYMFCMKSARRKDNTILWLSAILVLCPLSIHHFSILYAGAFYLPHVAIEYVVLGMILLYSQTSGRSRLIMMTVSVLLNFVAGLGGPRYIFTLGLPLLIIAALDWLRGGKGNKELQQNNREQAKICMLLGTTEIIGYLVNSQILQKIYTFYRYDNISFVPLSANRLIEIINGLLSIFGYSSGYVGSYTLLWNGICFLWIILTIAAIVRCLKHKTEVSAHYLFVARFATIAWILHVVLFLFTDMLLRDRYCIPQMALSVPLLYFFITESDWRPVLKKTLAWFFVLLMVMNTVLLIRSIPSDDPKLGDEFHYTAVQEMAVADYLEKQGFLKGYSTFWNGNQLTEISNGTIEVWAVGQFSGPHFYDNLFRWLQKAEHFAAYPEGKVFVLFSREEWEANELKNNLSYENMIYDFDPYVIYGYNSMDELMADAEK